MSFKSAMTKGKSRDWVLHSPPGQLVKPSRRDKHLGGGGCRCLRDCSGLHSQLQPEFHSETLEKKKKWVAM